MRRFVPCFVYFCLLIWGLPQTASAQADTRRANRPLSTETVKKASRKQELRAYNQKLSRRYLAGLTKWKLYKGAIRYELIEIKPTFNGGTINEFHKWVNHHLEWNSRDMSVESSRVAVRMLLSENGEILDVENIGPRTQLSHSFMKTIWQAPAWTPGRHQGHPCRTVILINTHICIR